MSGAVMVAWVGATSQTLWLAALLGFSVVVMQWFLWRKGGWLRRREERLFPSDEQSVER